MVVRIVCLSLMFFSMSSCTKKRGGGSGGGDAPPELPGETEETPAGDQAVDGPTAKKDSSPGHSTGTSTGSATGNSSGARGAIKLSAVSLVSDAADGFINTSESSLDNATVSVTGEGYDQVAYVVRPSGLTCDAGVDFSASLGAAPKNTDIATDGGYRVCVRLTSKSGASPVYGFSPAFTRDTQAPAIDDLTVVDGSAADGFVNAAERLSSDTIASVEAADGMQVSYAVVSATDACAEADFLLQTAPVGTDLNGLSDGDYVVCAKVSKPSKNTTVISVSDFTIDSVALTVTVVTAQTSPTTDALIHMSVTFNKTVSDFTTATLATAGIVNQSFSGSGTAYEFDSPISPRDSKAYIIAAAAAHDAAGNASSESNKIDMERSPLPPVFGGILDVLATSDQTSLMVFWAPATDTVTAPADIEYDICFRIVGGSSAWNCASAGTGVTYGTLGSLDLISNTYEIKVAAINDVSLSVDGGKTKRASAVSVITQAAAGETFTCAVTSAGGLLCWGDNTYGQLGDGTTVSRPYPALVLDDVGEPVTAVTQVSTGQYHACALIAGGLKCWGLNTSSQLGDASTTERHTPTQVQGLTSGVTQVSAGQKHTCAVISGALKCWGDGGSGRIGDGGTAVKNVPTGVTGLGSGVLQVSAGQSHTCAVVTVGADDALKCWGLNDKGQLGDGLTAQQNNPKQVTGLTTGVSRVSAGQKTTCAVVTEGEDETLKCWGFNSNGQLGDGTTTDKHSPLSVTGLTSGVSRVAVGMYHVCAVVNSGLYCWGNNTYKQLGDGSTTAQNTPQQVAGLTSGVTEITAAKYQTCAAQGGSLKCWGGNDFGQTGTKYASPYPVTVPTSPEIVSSITVGTSHSCALTAAGQVLCWGQNAIGQLGDGTYVSRYAPAPVLDEGGDPLTGVSQLASGTYHTCAISAGGALFCWGQNTGGKLGNGLTVMRPTPTEIIASGVTQVAAGAKHTCAILGDSLKCWGANASGQLGDGTTTAHYTPTPVPSLTSGVTKVAVGDGLSCAVVTVETEDTLRCWGANNVGQLGDGTKTEQHTPTQVQDLTSGVSKVSIGTKHTCAIVSAGLKCWGDNTSGQLGDGTTTEQDIPTSVVGLASGVADVAAGSYDTCAVSDLGGLKCWGKNTSGQLGDNSAVDKTEPAQVMGLASGVSRVAMGDGHACAVSGGMVFCWGINSYGQLGSNAHLQNVSAPFPVISVAAGDAP